jgi:hypothetical protein
VTRGFDLLGGNKLFLYLNGIDTVRFRGKSRKFGKKLENYISPKAVSDRQKKFQENGGLAAWVLCHQTSWARTGGGSGPSPRGATDLALHCGGKFGVENVASSKANDNSINGNNCTCLCPDFTRQEVLTCFCSPNSAVFLLS